MTQIQPTPHFAIGDRVTCHPLDEAIPDFPATVTQVKYSQGDGCWYISLSVPDPFVHWTVAYQLPSGEFVTGLSLTLIEHGSLSVSADADNRLVAGSDGLAYLGPGA